MVTTGGSLAWPDPIPQQRERVWEIAIEQFVALCTNHSTVFSHMLPGVRDEQEDSNFGLSGE